jgi:hypothetical protein
MDGYPIAVESLNMGDSINWRSQIVTTKEDKMGLRRQPYAFSKLNKSAIVIFKELKKNIV